MAIVEISASFPHYPHRMDAPAWWHSLTRHSPTWLFTTTRSVFGGRASWIQ